jgi:phage gp36-like protein
MSYATQQNLIDRFTQRELAQLTDTTNSGAIDAAVVAVALADADAEINSYIGARYSLPLAQTTPELVRLASDIARYRLWDASASEEVKARYDDAVKKLRDVSKNVASLGIDQASQPVAEVGGVQVSAGGRVFNAVNLADY